MKTNRKPLTYRRAVAVITGRLFPTFGTKKPNDISAWDIERYKKARKEAGNAPATINLDLAFLKAILNKAVTWKKLAEHPAKDVKALKGAQEKTRFLSEEEETCILAVCSPALRRVVDVGLLTGFRRQELVTLRPEDIDLVRETVTVAACYAKNGESRTLPMGPRLRTALEEALAARGDAATVLVTRRGTPWSVHGLTGTFRHVSVRAGLEELGPHVMRHTFASRLVMAGVDLRTVQELMGHKNIQMTMRYAHLSPHHKRSAMEALESRFPAKSPIESHNSAISPTSTISKKAVVVR